MKKIRPLRCLPLLLLAFATALPASASEPATPKVVTPRPELTAANEEAERLGQTVYQVLLAEVALRRGNPMLAATAYADLARRTRDPKALERAVDTAGFARRFDLALDAARQWVEVEPGSRQAQYTLASAMILANQLDELPAVLIGMLEADKESLHGNLLSLNRMLSLIPNKQHLFQVIDKVCQPYFGIAEAHYSVAVAAATAGNYQRGLAEVRQVMELRPDWETGAVLQAKILANITPAQSIAYLHDFLDKYPQAQEARLHLARVLLGEKRYAEARSQFDQLLKSSPDNPEVVFPVAMLALQHQDLALAETQLKHFLNLPFANKDPACFYLGQIAEESQRTAEAMSWYAQVSSGEHYVSAQIRRARLLVDLGRFEEARWQLSSAKANSPEERIQLSIAEAGLLRDAKQTQAAFELLDSLLTKNPDQIDLLYESALLAEKQGNIELMETRLRRIISLRPDNAMAYNALGYSLADRNLRLPEARQLIEKALSLSPEDYFILDSMGWVLFRQGELDAALDYLEKAFARHADPEIAAHLAEVLWVQGRKEEARRVWNEARKKHPANESLSDVTQRLGGLAQ